jgi:hypothetical protein
MESAAFATSRQAFSQILKITICICTTVRVPYYSVHNLQKLKDINILYISTTPIRFLLIYTYTSHESIVYRYIQISTRYTFRIYLIPHLADLRVIPVMKNHLGFKNKNCKLFVSFQTYNDTSRIFIQIHQ